MSITLTVETGAAPQGGSDAVFCTVPATRAAFATAAATAVASAGGFITVTVEKEGKTQEELYNVNKIRAVV
jgi:hypothetical protein